MTWLESIEKLDDSTAAPPAAEAPSEARQLPWLILIAGSAGALMPLRRLVRALGPDLDAAVLITIHHLPDRPTLLGDILTQDTPLPVSIAAHGELLCPGHVYVAPPGYHHVTVGDGRVWLLPHPRHALRGNSADPLLTSAAREFGPRAIGVVLSGANRNGAAGMQVIRAAGGYVAAQDPREAAHATMPLATLEGGVDLCADAEAIGHQLALRCRAAR
jgi:chemotaxis response regulator CheB